MATVIGWSEVHRFWFKFSELNHLKILQKIIFLEYQKFLIIVSIILHCCCSHLSCKPQKTRFHFYSRSKVVVEKWMLVRRPKWGAHYVSHFPIRMYPISLQLKEKIAHKSITIEVEMGTKRVARHVAHTFSIHTLPVCRLLAIFFNVFAFSVSFPLCNWPYVQLINAYTVNIIFFFFVVVIILSFSTPKRFHSNIYYISKRKGRKCCVFIR